MNREKTAELINENPSKTTVAEMIYLLYFAIMLFARGIGWYESMFPYTISLLLGMLLFGIKILSTKHTLFEYLWMGALLILSLVVYHNTGEKGLLVFVTMMLGLKAVSMKKVFRTGIVVWFVAFWTIVVLSLTGIVDERIFMHNKNGIGYLICHSLGYSHSNVLHISYIVLMIFVIYNLGRVNFKKLMLVSAALMIGNVYIFMYSVSYTGFVAATLYLLFNIYFQMRKKISIVEKVLIQLIFPICVLFSVVGPIVIKGNLFDLINKAMNTRYFLSNYFLTQQPITLLGSRLVVPNYRYTMDCSYVYAFVQLGIIPFAISCVLFFALIRDCLKKDRRVELAVILGLCVAGVAEPFMFNLSYKNLIFLFAGAYLFRLSDSIGVKLPECLKRHIQLIKIGDRIVSDNCLICDRLYSAVSKFFTMKNRKSAGRVIIAAFLGMTITGAVFVTAVQKPQYIYIDEDTNENMELEPVYLSEEDVSTIEGQGNYFFNYKSIESPMYAYSGGTATIEYYRIMVSMCLAVFVLIVIIGIVIMKRRKCNIKRVN